VGAVLAMLAAAYGAGRSAASAQNASGDPYELMYLPEGKILRAASLGHRSFLADIVWLRTIQYYGEQRLTTRNYDQAERLFQVIYDLAPTFKGATRFGALVLSQDAGNPEGALALLARAAADDPLAWEYPFDAGFIYQTCLSDYARAGEAYRRASMAKGAPPLAGRLAGQSFARFGDRASAREIWQEILAGAENDMSRRLAERNLVNLDVADAEEKLTAAVLRFRVERGRIPANWEEMVRAGAIDAVPAEPWGGAYFFDAGTGQVWSSTTVDRRMATTREVFRGYVRAYAAARGARPATLEDLVAEGFARFPPWEPFGLRLEYDAATGRVAWNPPWPASEPGLHGTGEAAS
jgi:tetratricopeptide (TPR) repeat protein